MLNPQEAVAEAHRLRDIHTAERKRLDLIREYLRDEQRLDWLPATTPEPIRRFARLSRVNVLPFVVDASVQSLYLDGYRTRTAGGDEPAWELWQANGMDARQVGIHRAALSYGAAYAVVLPGEPVATVRGVSARNMTALYGTEDEWPVLALEKRRAHKGELWRLFDDEAAHWIGQDPNASGLEYLGSEIHGAGVVPVVRYQPTYDLDGDVQGDVEPLFRLQDQINLTTFALLVAQHYGAHRQRYILGWMAKNETERAKASASELWTFDMDPSEIQVGEFEQTDLAGYIDSREATLRHLATISQTPVHELLGSLANLSAEALVAARDSHSRKLTERQVILGEAHEQTLRLAGTFEGLPSDMSAYVRWRDMESRSLAQTADALGKLVQMLGIPPEAMWERVPGVTQDEVERWKVLAARGGALEDLMRELAANDTPPEIE